MLKCSIRNRVRANSDDGFQYILVLSMPSPFPCKEHNNEPDEENLYENLS